MDKDLPRGWRKESSKSRPDTFYYYNANSKKSVWHLEEVYEIEKSESKKKVGGISDASKGIKKNLASDRLKNLQEKLKESVKRENLKNSELVKKVAAGSSGVKEKKPSESSPRKSQSKHEIEKLTDKGKNVTSKDIRPPEKEISKKPAKSPQKSPIKKLRDPRIISAKYSPSKQKSKLPVRLENARKQDDDKKPSLKREAPTDERKESEPNKLKSFKIPKLAVQNDDPKDGISTAVAKDDISSGEKHEVPEKSIISSKEITETQSNLSSLNSSIVPTKDEFSTPCKPFSIQQILCSSTPKSNSVYQTPDTSANNAYQFSFKKSLPNDMFKSSISSSTFSTPSSTFSNSNDTQDKSQLFFTPKTTFHVETDVVPEKFNFTTALNNQQEKSVFTPSSAICDTNRNDKTVYFDATSTLPDSSTSKSFANNRLNRLREELTKEAEEETLKNACEDVEMMDDSFEVPAEEMEWEEIPENEVIERVSWLFICEIFI